MKRKFLEEPVFVLFLGLTLFASCGKKSASIPPAPKPPTGTAGTPVAEPQTRANLPPEQRIPEGAVPEGPVPLAGDAGRLPSYSEPQIKPEPVVKKKTPVEYEEPAPEPRTIGPVPRLGQVLSTTERRELAQTIDRSLAAAQGHLELALGQTLTTEEADAVRRIRAFMRQAEQARKQDLTLAKNLAERAQLLAQDLARNLR